MRVDYDKDQLAYALANALKERDEAREKAERYRIEANAIMMQRDEWAAMCGRYKQERDESQEKYATEATEHMLAVNKLCNERDEAQADCLEQARLLGMGSEREARLISERDEAREVLQAVLKTGNRLERERDEAREHLKLNAVWQSLRDSQDEVLRLTFENRELRNLSNE